VIRSIASAITACHTACARRAACGACACMCPSITNCCCLAKRQHTDRGRDVSS